MKSLPFIVALTVKYSDLEIDNFLNVIQSFICKIKNELQASGSDVLPAAKREMRF